MHDSLYFLKAETILLCKMSGHSLKTKTPGADLQSFQVNSIWTSRFLLFLSLCTRMMLIFLPALFFFFCFSVTSWHCSHPLLFSPQPAVKCGAKKGPNVWSWWWLTSLFIQVYIDYIMWQMQEAAIVAQGAPQTTACAVTSIWLKSHNHTRGVIWGEAGPHSVPNFDLRNSNLSISLRSVVNECSISSKFPATCC